MPATPTDTLINDARCVDSCVPYGMRMAVLISLFAHIAGVPTDTDSLINGAKCVQDCIPDGMKLSVLISLADQINQGGGSGGGGGSCLGRSVGPPVWIPPAGCSVGLNFDDAGGFWWYDVPSAKWIIFG